jgi:hypothetical protein
MAIVGSGAGGSGAGGSGAGGSGAGGSGAGGSGAGGSGAGGHAGGISSPLLNTALTVTSDAITGYWEGKHDRNPAALPRGHDDLSYLTPSRRMSMFAAESLGRFRVKTGSAAKVKVKLDNHDIHKTKVPDDGFFKEQLIWLRNYADLRADRIPEINTQVIDLLSFQGMIGQLDAGAHKYTLEALGVVQDVTYSVTMQLKHLVWAPRPIAYSTRVHPIIQTPDHSTFPSAHASEAFAMAVVLDYILNRHEELEKPTPPMAHRVAHRISTNRTIAGVHFPVDSAAGAELGIAMGHAMLALMFAKEFVLTEFNFGSDPGQFDKGDDFLLSDLNYQPNGAGNISETNLPLFGKIYGEQINQEWGYP